MCVCVQAMAEDDVDFRAILNKENVAELGKETTPTSHTPTSHPLPSVSDSLASSLSPTELSPSQPSAFVEIPVVPCGSGVEEAESKGCVNAAASKSQEELFGMNGTEEVGGVLSGGRWDKSLGVLCQKFVMLFLVTPVSYFTKSVCVKVYSLQLCTLGNGIRTWKPDYMLS